MLESNRFTLRTNRFKSAIFNQEEYDFIDFNGNLKSVNLEELKFTNFVNSSEKKIYKELKEICISLLTSNTIFNNSFLADEIKELKSKKIQRLYDIISKVNGRKVKPEEAILKFKNKNNPELQFYIKKDGKILKVFLIDLYHLGIDAKHKAFGKYDLVGRYNAYKKCKYDIANIQLEIEELLHKDYYF